MLAAQLQADEDEMFTEFNQHYKKLQVEHCVVETDWQHEFHDDLVEGKKPIKSSPYMIVRSDNDNL
jgi:hypothetical protein